METHSVFRPKSVHKFSVISVPREYDRYGTYLTSDCLSGHQDLDNSQWGKVNDAFTMCKDVYLLQCIDDTLDALHGSQCVSTLDLYSWCWQVNMDAKDIHKTVFLTHQELFHFMVMVLVLQYAVNFPAAHGTSLWAKLEDLPDLPRYDVIVYGGNFYDVLAILKMI